MTNSTASAEGSTLTVTAAVRRGEPADPGGVDQHQPGGEQLAGEAEADGGDLVGVGGGRRLRRVGRDVVEVQRPGRRGHVLGALGGRRRPQHDRGLGRGRVVHLDRLGGGGVVVDRADRCVDERVDQRALALLELADDEDRAGRLLEAAPGGGHAGVEVGPVAAAQQGAEGVDAGEARARGRWRARRSPARALPRRAAGRPGRKAGSAGSSRGAPPPGRPRAHAGEPKATRHDRTRRAPGADTPGALGSRSTPSGDGVAGGRPAVDVRSVVGSSVVGSSDRVGRPVRRRARRRCRRPRCRRRSPRPRRPAVGVVVLVGRLVLTPTTSPRWPCRCPRRGVEGVLGRWSWSCRCPRRAVVGVLVAGVEGVLDGVVLVEGVLVVRGVVLDGVLVVAVTEGQVDRAVDVVEARS